MIRMTTQRMPRLINCNQFIPFQRGDNIMKITLYRDRFYPARLVFCHGINTMILNASDCHFLEAIGYSITVAS
jgi:hypothetical protein